MSDSILQRGPDDDGYYISGQIGLGFRRLSIIDLVCGPQPLSNEDGTIWIVFNGEIYNFQDLREGLLKKGHIFRTKTDTEVIVHLYEEYGEALARNVRFCHMGSESEEAFVGARSHRDQTPLLRTDT